MKKLKWNIPVETEIEYSCTIQWLRDNTCIEEQIDEYQDKLDFINDTIYHCTIYYEDIMDLYRALQRDGQIDIYEIVSTNEQLERELFNFLDKVVEEVED